LPKSVTQPIPVTTISSIIGSKYRKNFRACPKALLRKQALNPAHEVKIAG
jgi:hypothetical protein